MAIADKLKEGTLWQRNTAVVINALETAVNARLPSGSLAMWLTSSAPTGWLICDGTAVSRTTYAALFAVIGTIGGAGDGSTTFNLPDMRQKFPLGKAASGTGSTLGGTGGAIDHTHSVPAHYHGMGTGADLNITSSGAHSHSITRDGNSATNSGAGALWGLASGGTAYSNTESASHTHTSGTFAGKIGLVTGGVDGNTAMTSGTANAPFIAVNFIIKT